MIRYHGWWPSNGDPYYQYNVSQNTQRINYYGADYSPHLHIDGNVDGGGTPQNFQGIISGEMTVVSPLEIAINGAYNPISRECQISVGLLATGPISNTNLKLRIALVESNLEWQAPNGSRWHHQTFRHMYPSASGVSFTISEGQTYEYDYSFTLNSQLVDENCDLVVFVQSDNGHRILQGALERVTTLAPLNTLEPFGLIDPYDGEIINTCYPHFVWESTDDPNSENEINYRVYVAQDPGFTSPIISDPTADTSYTSIVCLIPEITYYWKVLASNGVAPDRYSDEDFTFTIVEAPVPTLSEWGMIIMTLILLAIGTASLVRKRQSRPALK